MKYHDHPQHPEVEEPLSPASEVFVRNYRRPPGSSKAIPAEDLVKLIEVAQHNTSEKLRRRDYAIILFLADTGCWAGGLHLP